MPGGTCSCSSSSSRRCVGGEWARDWPLMGRPACARAPPPARATPPPLLRRPSGRRTVCSRQTRQHRTQEVRRPASLARWAAGQGLKARASACVAARLLATAPHAARRPQARKVLWLLSLPVHQCELRAVQGASFRDVFHARGTNSAHDARPRRRRACSTWATHSRSARFAPGPCTWSPTAAHSALHPLTCSRACAWLQLEFAAAYHRLCGRRVLFPQGFHCTGMPIKVGGR